MKHEREGTLETNDSDVPFSTNGDGDQLPPRARRRFRRARPTGGDEAAGASESLASMHAELVLLREENARLKAAQHRRSDVARLLGRARSLPSAETDGQRLEDDAAQLLVDGLVIRESLAEICEEIERSMVAFGARLSALGMTAADRSFPPEPGDELEPAKGHGPPRPQVGAASNPEKSNGHGPT
jgi:hypothetical protein